MDKVRSTLFPGAGGTDDASADGIPWWMKYLAKTVAILAGLGKAQYCTFETRQLQLTDKSTRLHSKFKQDPTGLLDPKTTLK